MLLIASLRSIGSLFNHLFKLCRYIPKTGHSTKMYNTHIIMEIL